MKLKNKINSIMIYFICLVFVVSSILVIGIGDNKVAFADSDVEVSLNVGEDISMSFNAQLPSDAKNITVNFLWVGLNSYNQTYTEDDSFFNINDDGSISFSYRGITPQNMGKEVTVTISYENAQNIPSSIVKKCSVKSYCDAVLSKTQDELGLTATAYEKLQILMVDMLNYGASAQTYTSTDTNALVNADVTKTGTNFSDLSSGLSSVKATTGDIVFKTGVHYDNKLQPTTIFTLPEGVIANNLQVATYLDGELQNTVTPETVEQGYQVIYEDFNIIDVDTPYTFSVINAGAEIASLTDSFMGIAFRFKDDTSVKGQLIQKTYVYGNSVQNYWKSVAQTTRIEAENAHIEGKAFNSAGSLPLSYTNNISELDTLSGGKCIKNIKVTGNTITFTIESDKASLAKLNFSLANYVTVNSTKKTITYTAKKFSTLLSLSVNGQDKTFSSDVGESKTISGVKDNYTYFQFYQVSHTVNLQKGVNVIVLTATSTTTNIDFIEIITQANITDKTVANIVAE